jgi:predicted nicotinamide N-methyase
MVVGAGRAGEDGGVIAAQFVRSATALVPVPLVPELCLHLTADIYSVWESTEAAFGRGELPPPFWSVAWPGGQALARYLLDRPALMAGRRVLDYGAGSGLVALAAARAGAATVVACEPDELAQAAICLNAAANDLTAPDCVSTAELSPQPPEVVMAADVWYEKDLAELVGGYLATAQADGAQILIADIGCRGRKYFPRTGYEKIASYELPSTLELEGREIVTASVWQATSLGRR